MADIDNFLSLFDSLRSKPGTTTRRLRPATPSLSPSHAENIFDKLHYESLEIKTRNLRREFESKKKKDEEDRLSCTFRPSSNAITILEDPEAFYNKNIDWLERRNR